MIISTRRSVNGRFLQRVNKTIHGFSFGQRWQTPFIEFTGEGQDGIAYRVVMSEDDLAKANAAMTRAKEMTDDHR